MDDSILFIENDPVFIDHPGIDITGSPLLEVVGDISPASPVFEVIDWPRRSYVGKERLPEFREKVEVAAAAAGFEVVDIFLSDFFAWQSVLPSGAVRGRLGRVAYSWNGDIFPERQACDFLSGCFPGWKKVNARNESGFLELPRTLAIIEVELSTSEGKLSLAVLQKNAAEEFNLPGAKPLEFPTDHIPPVQAVTGSPESFAAFGEALRMEGSGLSIGVLLGRTRAAESEIRKAATGAMLPIAKMEYAPAALVELRKRQIISTGSLLNIGGAFAFRADRLLPRPQALHGSSSLPLGFVFAGKTMLPPEQMSDWENGTIIELGNSDIMLSFPGWADFSGDFITNGEKAWFVFGEENR